MEKRKSPLVRDTDTGGLLELLMVIAVVTILVNRALLAATGYPQLSPGDLHIAHMLWGGFLMFIALVMVFRYWNPSIRRLAAFIGGMGFGLFIDELGKFITASNDYFYKPTIAVIYVIFIAMFLLFRGFAEKSELSSRELSVNKRLRKDLGDMHDSSSRLLVWYDAAKEKFENSFDRVIAIKGFVPALMIIFVVLSLFQLGMIFGLITHRWFMGEETSGYALIGTVVSGCLVVMGVFALRRSLVKAFQWFKRAVLVSIFITQIFLFYHSQLAAIGGLAVDLLFYSAIENFLRKHNL